MSNELPVSRILDAVNSGSGLKTLDRLMKLVAASASGSKPDLKVLKELIQYDVATSSAVLRAANRPGKYDDNVMDIPSAIKRIGSHTLRNLALSTGFIDLDTESDKYDPSNEILQWLWERSLFNATSARQLAIKLGRDNPEHYYALGLMLDIGAHFLFANFQKHYYPVLKQWQTEGGMLTTYEHDALGIDHTTVGQHLAHAWNFGPDFEQAIKHHHSPKKVASDNLTMDVLQLAIRIGEVFFRAKHVSELKSISDYSDKEFGLNADALANVLQRIALEADKSTYRLSIDSSTGVSSIDLLRIINTELGRATLSYDQMVSELETAMKKAETLAMKLEEANIKLRKAANIDPLTKVYNRRFFEEFLNWNFQRARRYKSTLGCMMIDIDFFKKFNDNYGHLTGDRVLQGVASALKGTLRGTDILARFGGEEFIVLLPESSPKAVCLAAKKLHKAVENSKFPVEGKDLSVTICIGHHYYNGDEELKIDSAKELVRIADTHVYKAKENGRNQVWPAEVEE